MPEMTPHTAVVPPSPLDSPVYEQALVWLERLCGLLDHTHGWTDEVRAAVGGMAQALALVASGDLLLRPGTPVPAPAPDPAPVVPPDQTIHSPRHPRRRPSAPQPSPNGHHTPARQWSLNERLQEFGYPEDLDRSARVKLGQAAVEAYRQARGKAPQVAGHGRGVHATRVSLYAREDLPLIDAVIQQLLGDPPGIETPVGSKEEATDAGPGPSL
jgi:hypothetical protein